MNNIDNILSDAITYLKLQNDNYKKTLYEAYDILKINHINNVEKFNSSKIDTGLLTYQEITIFDRLSNEDYNRALASFAIKHKETIDMPDDYGDRLLKYNNKKLMKKR